MDFFEGKNFLTFFSISIFLWLVILAAYFVGFTFTHGTEIWSLFATWVSFILTPKRQHLSAPLSKCACVREREGKGKSGERERERERERE